MGNNTVNNKKQSFYNDYQFWMMCGTLIIAISTIFSVWLTSDKMQGQIELMQKSNEVIEKSMAEQIKEMKFSSQISYRPFLNIDYFETSFIFSFLNRKDSLRIEFKDLKISSNQFKDYDEIICDFFSNATFTNLGKSPLRIKSRLSSTLLQEEWFNVYNKNAKHLKDSLLKFNEWSELETDFVILNDSSQTMNQIGTMRTYRKENILNSIFQQEESIFYLYTYVEYEDYFGNSYNTLFMVHCKIQFFIDEDIINFPDSLTLTVEKIRWDF